MQITNKSQERVGASFSVCGKSIGGIIHVAPDTRTERSYARISDTQVEQLHFAHQTESITFVDEPVDLDNIEKVEVTIRRFVKVAPATLEKKGNSEGTQKFSQETTHLSKKIKSMGDIATVSGVVENREKNPSVLKSIYEKTPFCTFQLYCKWRPNLQLMQLPGMPPTKFSEWNSWATERLTNLTSHPPSILRPCFDIPQDSKQSEHWSSCSTAHQEDTLQKLQLKHIYSGELLKAVSFALFGNGQHTNLLKTIIKSEENAKKQLLLIRDFFEIDFVVLTGFDNPIHLAAHFPYPEKKCFILTYFNRKYGAVAKVASDLPPLIDLCETQPSVIEID